MPKRRQLPRKRISANSVRQAVRQKRDGWEQLLSDFLYQTEQDENTLAAMRDLFQAERIKDE